VKRMDAKRLDFKIFCLENYKLAHHMKGEKAMEVFKQFHVFDYLNSFYDVLHSTGQKHLIHDIDRYIESRKREMQ